MDLTLPPGIAYRNDGRGFYGSYFLYNVELPSGERVAAAVNTKNVQTEGDTYSGDSILPVGTLVYEELSENEDFMKQIETAYPLTRTDFYVDMADNSGTAAEEDYSGMKKAPFLIAAFLITFPLIHMLGARLGLFPYFFIPKKKKESKWQ